MIMTLANRSRKTKMKKNLLREIGKRHVHPVALFIVLIAFENVSTWIAAQGNYQVR
jgi:hypothetical protein